RVRAQGPSSRHLRDCWSGAGRYGASGSGLKKPQAGTPVLRRGAFPDVQAPCETVGKGRYPIFETTSGVVLGRARILTWHRATLRFAPSLRPSQPARLAPFRESLVDWRGPQRGYPATAVTAPVCRASRLCGRAAGEARAACSRRFGGPWPQTGAAHRRGPPFRISRAWPCELAPACRATRALSPTRNASPPPWSLITVAPAIVADRSAARRRQSILPRA